MKKLSLSLSTFKVWMGTAIVGLILLQGHQAQATPEVSATATTNASNLDLDGTGHANTHIVKVADINVSTTNSNGLELFISNGYLTEEENRTIEFQVTTVANDAAVPVASAFTNGDYTYQTSLSGSEARDVYIKYVTNAVADPGNYSTIIQFTVTDNP